jgi:ribonuclease P protein component
MRAVPRAASASLSPSIAMARSPAREGFSGRHRFTARGSFAPALRSPRKLRGSTIVLNVAEGGGNTSRLGIALTRRMVPLASRRNFLKRLVREAFRRHEVKSRGIDCVVALRKPFDASAAAALRDEVLGLFDQLLSR